MALPTKFDTAMFEVQPEFTDDGVLAPRSVDEIRAMLDTHGFVILPGFMTAAEVSDGMELMARTLAEGGGEVADFASETDIAFRRRDFHAVPWDEPAKSYVSALMRRTGDLLKPYCEEDASLLEVCTMISRPGSSHQYIHRDPPGVISGFIALEDVDRAMGGTVFVPGSHLVENSDLYTYVRILNAQVMGRNLRKLLGMRFGRGAAAAPGELRQRLFSSLGDKHQPNIRAFLTGQNPYLSVRDLVPKRVAGMLLRGRRSRREFQLVGTTPARATMLIYHSSIMHAGPDNVSDSQRSLMNFSMSLTGFDPVGWRAGYSPHSAMIGQPTTATELLGWTGS